MSKSARAVQVPGEDPKPAGAEQTDQSVAAESLEAKQPPVDDEKAELLARAEAAEAELAAMKAQAQPAPKKAERNRPAEAELPNAADVDPSKSNKAILCKEGWVAPLSFSKLPEKA